MKKGLFPELAHIQKLKEWNDIDFLECPGKRPNLATKGVVGYLKYDTLFPTFEDYPELSKPISLRV
ncbi:unnamed protein product [Schistosoma curassoni]|nr:unnamed protein product [Schistosoma curassoni]